MKKYSITKINLYLKIFAIVFDFYETQKIFSFVYRLNRSLIANYLIYQQLIFLDHTY